MESEVWSVASCSSCSHSLAARRTSAETYGPEKGGRKRVAKRSSLCAASTANIYDLQIAHETHMPHPISPLVKPRGRPRASRPEEEDKEEPRPVLGGRPEGANSVAGDCPPDLAPRGSGRHCHLHAGSALLLGASAWRCWQAGWPRAETVGEPAGLGQCQSIGALSEIKLFSRRSLGPAGHSRPAGPNTIKWRRRAALGRIWPLASGKWASQSVIYNSITVRERPLACWLAAGSLSSFLTC